MKRALFLLIILLSFSNKGFGQDESTWAYTAPNILYATPTSGTRVHIGTATPYAVNTLLTVDRSGTSKITYGGNLGIRSYCEIEAGNIKGEALAHMTYGENYSSHGRTYGVAASVKLSKINGTSAKPPYAYGGSFGFTLNNDFAFGSGVASASSCQLNALRCYLSGTLNVSVPSSVILSSFYSEDLIKSAGNTWAGYFNGDVAITNKLDVRNAAQIDGELTIGAEDNEQNLSVHGIINAKKIVVKDPLTADFVFDENYELPSLSDVENFISKNKHLPEIPSASEMQQEGLDMVKMNQLLLQKIEELTLYVIELKKQNEAQQKDVDLLKMKHE